MCFTHTHTTTTDVDVWGQTSSYDLHFDVSGGNLLNFLTLENERK